MARKEEFLSRNRKMAHSGWTQHDTTVDDTKGFVVQ